MQKSGRYEDLQTIFPRKLDTCPFPIGWGTAPDIYGDIEDPPVATAHQFGLCVGGRLEMQPPDGSGISRVRVVVLHEPGRDSMRFQDMGVPDLAKPAPAVCKAPRFQNQNVGKNGFFNDHKSLAHSFGQVLANLISAADVCCGANLQPWPGL
jgi:hypothetical protein